MRGRHIRSIKKERQRLIPCPHARAIMSRWFLSPDGVLTSANNRQQKLLRPPTRPTFELQPPDDEPGEQEEEEHRHGDQVRRVVGEVLAEGRPVPARGDPGPAQHALVHTGDDHLLQDRLTLNVAEEGVNVDKICQSFVLVLLNYFFLYKQLNVSVTFTMCFKEICLQFSISIHENT